MAMNFPNSPTDGQVHTEQGMTFVWNSTASTWVMLGGESEIADPATIIRSGLPTDGWQIWGDTLIQWGIVTTSTSTGAVVTFPKAFKNQPSVVALPASAISNDERSVHMFSLSKTQVDFVAFNGANARIAVAVCWVAVGEALDDDKTPKIVQTVGGVTRFATEAESRAGLLADVIMSPALVQARSGIIQSGSLLGLQLFDFNIPDETTEFELLPNFCGPNVANANFSVRINGLTTGYISQQTRFVNNASPVALEATNGFLVGLPAASDNVMGAIRFIKEAEGTWFANGGLRINGTTQVLLTGRVANAGPTDFVRIVANSGTGNNFQATGGCSVRWKI